MSRPAFDPVKPRDPELPKAAVARLFNEAGGVQNVAVLLALKPAQIYAFADPGQPEEISFARVAALTAPQATAAAEYLAGRAGGVFLPIDAPDGDVGALTAESITQHGEAIASIVAALADGRLTGPERSKALQELDEALRALVQLRCAVVNRRDADA